MKKITFLLMSMMVCLFANATDYYLIGDLANSWKLKDNTTKFTDAGDGSYTLDYNGTINAFNGFKINDGDWDDINNFGSNGNNIVVGTEYSMGWGSSSGNIQCSETLVNPKFTLWPETKKLLITAQTEAAVAPELYLRGDMNSWGTGAKMTEENWVYTLTGVTITAGQKFKIAAADWTNAFTTGLTNMTANTTYAGYFGGENNNMAMAETIENATITFDFNAKTIIFSVETEPEVVAPEKLYIMDYFASKYNTGVEMTKNGNVFTGVATLSKPAVSWFGTDGAVFFSTGLADSATDYSSLNSNTLYGATSTMKIEIGAEVEIIETAPDPKVTSMVNCYSWKLAAGEYKFTVDFNTMKMIVSDPNAVEPEPDYSGWYVNVFGPFNDWQNNGINPTDGVVTLEDLAIGTSVFKVKVWNGEDVWYGVNTEIVPDTPTVLTEGNEAEMTIAGAVEGDIYNVTFDCATSTLTVTKVGNVPPTPADEYTYCLHGNIQGGDWGDIEMTEKDGEWTFSGSIVAGQFGIKKMLDGEQKAWLSADGNKNVNAVGEYSVKVNGSNFENSLEGNYTFTFNPTTNKLTVTEYDGPIEETIVYGINGQIWDGSNWSKKEFVQEGDVYVLRDVNVKPGEFGIYKNVNGVQKAWYWSADKATISAKGVFSLSIEPAEGKNFMSDLNGVATFTFDPEALTLTVIYDTGVETISMEEGEAVYFNLQGQRVANPERGIYIRVIGGKAVKVIK